MKCDEVIEKLAEGPEPPGPEIEAHLAACHSCREILEAQKEMDARLKTASESRPPLPADFAARVAAAVATSRTPSLTGWKIAAACALVLVSSAAVLVGGFFLDYNAVFEEAVGAMPADLAALPDMQAVLLGISDAEDAVYTFAAEQNPAKQYSDFMILYAAGILGIVFITAGLSAYFRGFAGKGAVRA